MNFVEVFTQSGWKRKDGICDLGAGDVFRISSFGTVGAVMVCNSAPRRVKLPSGDEGWHVDSRLLNAGEATVCFDCGAVLDKKSHEEDCPLCGSSLEKMSGQSFGHRVFVSPKELTNKSITLH